jgi:hypothetical protein
MNKNNNGAAVQVNSSAATLISANPMAKQPQVTAKLFKGQKEITYKVVEDNSHVTRRYSFDDNGGGYLGL